MPSLGGCANQLCGFEQVIVRTSHGSCLAQEDVGGFQCIDRTHNVYFDLVSYIS